jgi:molybdate transport repressor ModE-like protein
MEGWLGLETHHFAALVAVDREGSFRAAAASLGYAQSVVSQRVAQMEQLVGTRVVERSRGQGNVELTEAGRRLVAYADRIVAELNAALADLRALARQSEPVLRVGSYESASRRLLAGALAELSESAPSLQISLREEPDGARFFPLVASGALDIAFGELPLRPGPFAFRELHRDPCVLLVAADSPLAYRTERPTLEELGSLPLIDPGWPMLRLLADHLRAAGVEPRFAARSATSAGVQSLVAQGVGAALMPRLAVDETDGRIVAIPMDGLLPARRVCLYWHRARRHDAAIRRFLSALLAACALDESALAS